MPCSKGMRTCRRDCLHRVMVESYRDAVDATQALRESDAPAYGAAGAANSGAAMYQLSDAEFRELHPTPLFKDWLQAHARSRRDEP
jgi:hypothetical protein